MATMCRMGLKKRIKNWFSKRYGDDELEMFLYIVNFALLFLAFIPDCHFLVFIAIAGFVLTTFRALSSNIEKRSRENEIFLKILFPFRKKK
ncbi:MAG: hypothetical protein J5768_06750 [Spirochaetales bacterium]|nr:hypothetical protein [Spirochaetales bacterium]